MLRFQVLQGGALFCVKMMFFCLFNLKVSIDANLALMISKPIFEILAILLKTETENWT